MGTARFFLITFAISWALWLPAALLQTGVASGLGGLLYYSGMAGPLLATLVCLGAEDGRAQRQEYWRRLTNLGGLVSPAGALCVLIPLLVAQLARDSYAGTGGLSLPPFPPAGTDGSLLIGLLAVALAQELAWRGYALPAMLYRRNPLGPTLLLALLLGLWHLPLFFVDGTYQAGIGLSSSAAVMYFVGLAAQSIFMTAFYLATRSTWSAVVFHWLISLSGELWQLPAAAEMHRTLWMVLIAGIFVLAASPFGLRQSRPGTHR